MSNSTKRKNFFYSLVMIVVSLILVAGTILYLSHSLDSGKNIITLNGPWKFRTGDNMDYAQSGYDDSSWENVDFTAPPGVHDDDVGLSGYMPGWTANGHPNYSGYAWYRMNVPMDTLRQIKLALAAPPAVDDAYQLFVNGSLSGNAGDFSKTVPMAYSIQPRMFLFPKNLQKENNCTIAFRVWMDSASLFPGSGGIHIAPTLGEKTEIEKTYKFQWAQTIKGYIVEVVLPMMFILLATTMFLLKTPTQSCTWFITALFLVGLLRLNQAVYFWFQIESSHQAIIIGTIILRPLVLGSWLMAWREWFDLPQPKWLPKIIAILTLLFMVSQALGSNSLYTHFQTIAGYLRLVFLALMLVTAYQGIRKQGAKDLLGLVAMVFVTIALYPQEVSQLHVIPGIWFPYGVGVSRGQYFYAVFIFVMHAVLIRRTRRYDPS